jgi:hypothetical protein
LRETESLFHYIPAEKEDVTVKDIRDYYRSSTDKAINGISLTYKSATGLCATDPHSYFFSENNTDILEKIEFDTLSPYFEPPLTVSKKYDYWFGSPNAYTPARYHIDSGHFLAILPGQGIRVKMCPWRSYSSLSPIKDYENYEFWSKTDIWKHFTGKCLEFDVKAGYVLFIPSYWFYSIQYINVSTIEDSENHSNKVSSIACFQYVTVMNMIANLQHYGMYFLQQQNMVDTKARVIKPLEKEKEEKNEREEKEEKEISPEVAESIAMLQPKEEVTPSSTV